MFHAFQGKLFGEGVFKKDNVAALCIVDAVGLAEIMRCREVAGEFLPCHQLLKLVFPLIGQLEPVAGKNFNAVVLKRVMGGRDHNAGISPLALGHHGNARRGQRAEQIGISAHGTDAGHHSFLKHIA